MGNLGSSAASQASYENVYSQIINQQDRNNLN